VLGQGEAAKPLSEVLDHIRTLGFTMDQHIQADGLLFGDGAADLLLDPLVIFIRAQSATPEPSPRLANLGRLGKRADCRRW
jgi:hypothetical protein